MRQRQTVQQSLDPYPYQTTNLTLGAGGVISIPVPALDRVNRWWSTALVAEQLVNGRRVQWLTAVDVRPEFLVTQNWRTSHHVS